MAELLMGAMILLLSFLLAASKTFTVSVALRFDQNTATCNCSIKLGWSAAQIF